MSNNRRLLLSPLVSLVALITGLVVPTASAAAGNAAEIRVRAIPTAIADVVGQPSSETAGGVRRLRPSQPGYASGSQDRRQDQDGATHPTAGRALQTVDNNAQQLRALTTKLEALSLDIATTTEGWT